MVVYDEYLLMQNLRESFGESDDPYRDALDWFDYNILNGYIGQTTPVFYNLFDNDACRFNTHFENIKTLKDFSSMLEALEFIEQNHNAIVYVSCSYLHKIEDWV